MTRRRRALGPPAWLALPAALAVLLVLLPLLGMLASVRWGSWWALITTPASLDALGLSLRTATASTVLCVLIGIPLAILLSRSSSRAASALRTLVLLPLVLPPVVSGLALLATFGRRGLLGRELHLLGIDLAFSTAAVVLAQAFVSMPFLVTTVESALRTHDQGLEEAAATMGASPTTILWRVTLPLVRPALASGTVLAFARALGEFGATLTFAGSLQGRTRTLPLEIYLQREGDPAAAIALSLLLIVAAAVIVVGIYGRRALT